MFILVEVAEVLSVSAGFPKSNRENNHSHLGLVLNCDRYGIPWLALSLYCIHSLVLPEHVTDQ